MVTQGLSLAKTLSAPKTERFPAANAGILRAKRIGESMPAGRFSVPAGHGPVQHMYEDGVLAFGLRNHTLGSGSPVVTMVQPAESMTREDAAGSCGANPSDWRSLPEPEVRAVLVVVADVFGEQTFQMALV